MMRRLLIQLAVCLGALGFAAGPSNADDGSSNHRRSAAGATLSKCLQTRDRLSVLLLVDQSGSLDKTDPENLRVGGLGAALLGLKRLSRQPGAHKTVELLIAGFYYRVDTYPAGESPPRWTALSERSVPELLDEISHFKDLERHKGHDTDYAAAMLRARDLFRARTRELDLSGDGAPCKALIWFTDGNYEIDDDPGPRPDANAGYAKDIRLGPKNSGDAVERRGKRLLCDNDGTMDDLVRDEVVKFTVGLSTPEKRFDTALLRGMTDGSDGCGTLVTPAWGQFFPASSGKDLLFVVPILGGRPVDDEPRPDCPAEPCGEGETRFRLVDGLRQFVITADTGRAGVDAVLVAPSGRHLRLRHGEPDVHTFAGARITQRWFSDRQVEVDGELPSGADDWQGEWRVAFTRPADLAAGTVDRSVELMADVVAESVGPAQLTRGEQGNVRFRLRRAAPGSAANPLLGEAVVTTTVTGEAGSPQQPSGSERGDVYTAQVTAPRTTDSTVDLEVRVQFGQESDIAPVFGSFPIRVRPPRNYPVVAPERLELASISGAGTTSGILTITGSKTSSGCVWIAPPETEAPKEAGAVAFRDDSGTSGGRCLPVAIGETKRLRITFDPAELATGSVRSTLPVHLRSGANPGREEVTTVPVSFQLYPTGITEAIGRAGLLMLLGALLPLLILHALNLVAARFPPEHRVKFFAQDVTYVPGRGFVGAAGTPPSTDYGKFEWLSLETGSRKRSLDVDVLKLHTVASGSWNDRRFRLFQGPYGVASTDGADRIVAGAGTPLKELRGGRAHEVPLGLAGTWLLVIGEIDYGEAGATPPAVTAVAGRLILLIAADGDIDQGKELELEARTTLASHPWPPPDEVVEDDGDDNPPSRLQRLRESLPGRSSEVESDGSSWLDSDDDTAPSAGDRSDVPSGASGRVGTAPGATVNDDSDGPAGLRF